MVDLFLGEINILNGVNDTAEGRGSVTLSESEHSVNVWGLSSRLRSAVPRSVVPVRRGKDNQYICMESVLQKKLWKKQGKELKRRTVPGAVEPLSKY